jgi:type VI secretion system protein ImpG
MNPRLLKLYDIELGHLRRMADEFKDQHRKVANRLALGMDPPDPYVERLLEGFAFLTARIQHKLEAEFPHFIQSLLGTLCPHLLSPAPAMAIVRFVPDWSGSGMPNGYPIPAGTQLRSPLGGATTPCTFTTAHDVHLLPIALTSVRYYTRERGLLELPEASRAQAALGLTLRAEGGLNFNQIQCDRLVLHLSSLDGLAGMLYEHILARRTGLLVQSASRPVARYGVLPPSSLKRYGFSDPQALLPPGPRTFSGHRLLQEYFAFPRRFLFIELTGLSEAFRQCPGRELELVIPLSQTDARLEKRSIPPGAFELFCAPAINLFLKRGIPIDLRSDRSEHLVEPDKARPLDYEVYRIEEVRGETGDPGKKPLFHPFHFARDQAPPGSTFYTTHRAPRTLTERERKYGPVSEYYGTDLYLSLVDADAAPFPSELRALDVSALCSNRHLPMQMNLGGKTHFTIDLDGPIKSIECLARTPPKPALIEGETAWRALSHFTLNARALFPEPEGPQNGPSSKFDESVERIAENERVSIGACSLRELLRIYADPADPDQLAQASSIRAARARSIFERLPPQPGDRGIISFGRGLEITVELDEDSLPATGPFLLGAVLEQFLARHVSLNSFTQTVIRTPQREIMRWPPQIGRRQIL